MSFLRHILPATKSDIDHIMSKANEALLEFKAQIAKVKEEVLNKLTELETQLADQDLPDDAKATLAEAKALVQAVDDRIPDAPPPPTV